MKYSQTLDVIIIYFTNQLINCDQQTCIKWTISSKLCNRLSMKQLFDNNLSVNIFLISSFELAKDVLKERFPTIKKGKEFIFLKSNHQFKRPGNETLGKKEKPIFVYLSVNHPKMLQLHKDLFLKDQNQTISVQNLICKTTKGQMLDNIIEFEQKPSKQTQASDIKALFFKIYEKNGISQITSQLGLFLSIYEFFHSHTGLVLSLHDVRDYETFEALTQFSEKEFVQDDDELLSCSQYCRLFQPMPYKITNEEIALLADIESLYWGQIIRIEQGNDGILFWFLFDRHPIFLSSNQLLDRQNDSHQVQISNSQKSFIEKAGLKVCQQKFSHILLKSKSMIKQPLQNLCLKIVIMNVKKPKYCSNLSQIFAGTVENEVKKLCQNRAKSKQFEICQQSSYEIDRLCELLVNICPDSKKDINQRPSTNNEAEALSYNVNRWLYLKSKEQLMK